MKRLSMMVLWIVIGWAMVAGCAAPTVDDPAAVEEPLRTPLDSGSGACASGNHVCFIGDAQGSCLADGSCCLGCVDARGACQTGDGSAACGASGGACVNCDDGNNCTADACAAHVCQHGPMPITNPCPGGYCNPNERACCGGCLQFNPDSSAYDCVRSCTSGSCMGGQCATPCDMLNVNCDDGNPCTDDACTAGYCSHVVKSDGAICGPGVFDQCIAGICS